MSRVVAFKRTRHRDLIVRVGGYSDYFVNLEEGLQDNVIARSYIDMGI